MHAAKTGCLLVVVKTRFIPVSTLTNSTNTLPASSVSTTTLPVSSILIPCQYPLSMLPPSQAASILCQYQYSANIFCQYYYFHSTESSTNNSILVHHTSNQYNIALPSLFFSCEVVTDLYVLVVDVLVFQKLPAQVMLALPFLHPSRQSTISRFQWWSNYNIESEKQEGSYRKLRQTFVNIQILVKSIRPDLFQLHKTRSGCVPLELFVLLNVLLI